MGWRYKAGLTLIGAVVVIWVSSAEVTQSIFTDYQQPFAITYLGASLLVLYLPIAFIKDWLCKRLRSKLTGSNEFAQNGVSSVGTKSRSKLTEGKKVVRIEIQINPSDDQSDPVLSAQEEGVLLIAKQETRDEFCKEKRKFAAGDVSKYGLYLAPLWFVTEYLSNAALARTSVASTTVLSSTSGLFTLFIGVLLGQDSLNMAKVIAVLVSMAGVAMTTLGKTWATDESQISSASTGQRSMTGEFFGLLSALSYGLFTVLLKKFAREEGEGIDVQKLFGYVGLFTLVALWWLDWPLTALGIEPRFEIPRSLEMDEVVLANAFIGSFLCDYFWAQCVVWTTPLVATLGMSLTIPLAMVADMAIHGRHYSAVYVLGSVQVFMGFVMVNLSEWLSKKLGL